MRRSVIFVGLICLLLAGCNAGNNSTQSKTNSEKSAFKVGDLVYASRDGARDGAEFEWSEIKKMEDALVTVEAIGSRNSYSQFQTISKLLVKKENCGTPPVEKGDAVINRVPDGNLFFLSKVTSYSEGKIEVSLLLDNEGKRVRFKDFDPNKPVTYWCKFSEPISPEM